MTVSIVDEFAGPGAFFVLAGIFYIWVYYRINKYNCYGK